jgi:magnesium chelatase subunit I
MEKRREKRRDGAGKEQTTEPTGVGMATRQTAGASASQRNHPSHLPQTLGELRTSGEHSETRLRTRTVKDEMRENLIRRLQARETIFPGIIGYEDSVVPQIVNAVLSRQNFILLGLRGQAKSRILRALTALLDEHLPTIAGCEIRDNPYLPLCRRCRDLVMEQGDATPLGWISREERYVEKLATPDVTVADLIGDLDPIKAARGGHDLASEMTMHYGLLPRANRGIFAVNELPDLAGKIQVALFNIMQEGDVQIKGYPVRLELDVALVFSANPEDYTARGKIVTPLKDRIGSEIRTHYPETLEEGIAITTQEAWTERAFGQAEIPQYLREVVEQVAFTAREDKKVDKRSGVSQRLPIATMELAVSNAERRALLHGETRVVPRIGDLYTALPGITGKLELEYEGEMKGADTVVREIVRTAIGKVFDRYFGDVNTQQIEQWFNLGGSVKISDEQPAKAIAVELKQIQGLLEKLSPLSVKSSDAPESVTAAAEFMLEGMCAHHRISRNEERSFSAQKRGAEKPERVERADPEREYEQWQTRRSRRGSFN